MSRPSAAPARFDDTSFPFGANATEHEEPLSDLHIKFVEFHLANPGVYSTLVRLARQAVEAGKTHLGMKALFEVARWHIWLETKGDGFVLNNSYASRYARLIMQNEPDLRGLFHLRELRS